MSKLHTLLWAGALLAGLSGAAGAQEAGSASGQSQPLTLPETVENAVFVHGILNQFEGRTDGGTPDLRWSGQGWVGTDTDKFWVKTEGFLKSDGTVEDGLQQFLYSRAISTYFDLQAGLRSDLDSRTTRNWAAFGFQGLAPMFFDVEGTGYVSDQGHLAARFEVSYDLLLTQRLILQPQVEFDLYSKADPARLVGAGFSDIDAGLRLRYEIDRKFAPYIGVAYEGKFGETASLARRAGESTSDVRFVFGARSWF